MFENAFNQIDRTLRNDEGLASELDYAEQTSRVLFLKYLDDLEAERQDEAELGGRDYVPILAEPYRWRRWAAPKTADGRCSRRMQLLFQSRVDLGRACRADCPGMCIEAGQNCALPGIRA